MKRFYQDYNRFRVYQVKQILEDAGIPCILKNEFIQGAAGELPLNEALPEVWLVDNEWENKANQLLAEFEQDLDEVSSAGDWICGKCQSENEAEFGICWQCSLPKKEVDWN
ncbi:DUF2007 domain-containing protein [Glaciecola sp. 1036]|uniref:putative signal transducing protein n=1 Tax=Alteromonadaceae TaxID=72275 RepID=UPI003D07CFB1